MPAATATAAAAAAPPPPPPTTAQLVSPIADDATPPISPICAAEVDDALDALGRASATRSSGDDLEEGAAAAASPMGGGEGQGQGGGGGGGATSADRSRPRQRAGGRRSPRAAADAPTPAAGRRRLRRHHLARRRRRWRLLRLRRRERRRHIHPSAGFPSRSSRGAGRAAVPIGGGAAERLVNIGKVSAAPEQAALLRHRLDTTLLPALERHVRASLSAQVAAFEGARLAARRENKARAEALQQRIVGSGPSALVGERIEVHVEGGKKKRLVQVVSYDEGSERHTLQDVTGTSSKAAKDAEPLRLLGEGAEKWNRKDEPPPTPKYAWSAEASATLVEVCHAQLSACEREHEYAKHGLPASAEAAGRSAAHLASHADKWGADRAEHPEFGATLSAVVKVFQTITGNKAWMSERKVKAQFDLAQAQRKADKDKEREAAAAAAQAAAADKAMEQPPPAAPPASTDATNGGDVAPTTTGGAAPDDGATAAVAPGGDQPRDVEMQSAESVD